MCVEDTRECLPDCNGNGVPDDEDLAAGRSMDTNGNGIPDECEGYGDLNCDGRRDVEDIEPFVAALLDAQAYAAIHPDCNAVLADLNGDGTINAVDVPLFVAALSSP